MLLEPQATVIPEWYNEENQFFTEELAKTRRNIVADNLINHGNGNFQTKGNKLEFFHGEYLGEWYCDQVTGICSVCLRSSYKLFRCSYGDAYTPTRVWIEENGRLTDISKEVNGDIIVNTFDGFNIIYNPQTKQKEIDALTIYENSILKNKSPDPFIAECVEKRTITNLKELYNNVCADTLKIKVGEWLDVISPEIKTQKTKAINV